jgi:ubiquitin carboxyl-terminal hydrolase 6/32
MHKNATVLSKWLLVESWVNLSSDLSDTPTFYQSLAGVTHLEEADIIDLEKVFWYLKGCSITGQLDFEYISHLINPPAVRSVLQGLFLAFDENRDGHIDFKELCCGVSAACRGPDVERIKFCFKIFDIDRDGVLNFTEIEQMVDILLLVAKESVNFNLFKNATFDQVMMELYSYLLDCRLGKKKKKACDLPNFPADMKFPQEDFLMWCVESSLNIVQPFLDLLFELCHIVFCLKPQCKHLEFEIVRGYLSRERRRGYEVGQFWYLISTDWWQNWLQYTQFHSQSSSQHCPCKSLQNKLAIAQANRNGTDSLDEAMVCDESFASNFTESSGDLIANGDSSSLGSGSSGISMGKQQNFGPPGVIDNSSLLAPCLYKNIQTLTGEGAPLKKETLIQHRDFELVPDSLWKALAQWYGGTVPLPRQVIKPPNSNVKELEFYPLNLRILRHQTQQNTNQQQQSNNMGTWSSISGGYGALSGSYSNVSPVQTQLQTPKKYLAYTAAFSRLATVKQVGEFLCQRLKLRLEDIRLWHIMGPYSGSVHEVPYMLEEETMTLQDLLINDNDQILLEIRNKDLTWPEELSSISNEQTSSSTRERRATIASVQSVHPPGATGLHNLGNTW